jgi:hypothetical protein
MGKYRKGQGHRVTKERWGGKGGEGKEGRGKEASIDTLVMN